MKKIIGLALLVTLAQSWAYPAAVVKVIDGDTLKVRDASGIVRVVRVGQIDAPEKKQPYGVQSKQGLIALCAGKQAEITVETTDRYGREVAKVECAGTDAGLAQVWDGNAWVYPKYAHDAVYFATERRAKLNKKGLWADANPVPPWEWRKAQRGQ
jgi:micrococcal nuclease